MGVLSSEMIFPVDVDVDVDVGISGTGCNKVLCCKLSQGNLLAHLVGKIWGKA